MSLLSNWSNMFTVRRETPDAGSVAEQFRAIYEASFPSDEREDVEGLLADLRRGSRECYLAFTSGRVAGFAVVLRLTGCRDGVLEYLAVEPALRNAGLGSQILKCLRRELMVPAEAAITGLLFEVERPENAHNDEGRQLRERRIDFYRRNDAVVLTSVGEYRSPAMNRQGTVTYLLMWLPVTPDAIPPQGDGLRTCLAALMVESYGLAEDHYLVREAVAQVAG